MIVLPTLVFLAYLVTGRQINSIANAKQTYDTRKLNYKAEFAPIEDQLNHTMMIDYINNLNTSWKAGYNFHPNISKYELKSLMGVNPDYRRHLQLPKQHSILSTNSTMPAEFDSCQAWPECQELISMIHDTGLCGSDWAVATASAFSDRLCIASKGTIVRNLSAEDLSCCHFCGHKCEGGSPELAWRYLMTDGIVTGGSYQSKEGCKPYTIYPIRGYGQLPPQNIMGYMSAGICERKCQEEYAKDLLSDLYYAECIYSLRRNTHMRDIYNNGPVIATVKVYEDFMYYRSGIYQYTTGEQLGGHAVKIIGWGVENGVKYWLCVNSWGSSWGENGFFKIKRGNNECGIEERFNAGIPKV
ncbi:hypothetical protein V9T40_005031 [Parthenolecanium corni]|uniref:Peptidase C1A papain C-terminal domain-containing protein n=1 Tax=Parthenolecanium corni TaxID=536013 RepID=A0AAN9TD27_9HEMI